MHILHVAGALKGGPLSAIAEWARLQRAAGHRVSLAYSPLRDLEEEIRGELPGVTLYPVAMTREITLATDVPAYRALHTLMKDLKPDVVHLHSSKAGVLGRIAARRAGIPSIYSTHGMAYLRTDVGLATRMLFYAAEWLLGPFGDITVACSPSELKTMRFIPGRKTVIPNGIHLAAPTAPTTAHVGLEIVLCGRITAQKNPALAARIADRSPPDWRWTWLGGGELQDQVTKHGRIHVTGWLPRTEALRRLSAADVMVHTSSWEGMPIAILEAMSLSLPVIASDVVGNRDLIVNGETGYIVRDEAGFLAALNMLATAPALRRRLGAAARQRVEQEFDQARLGAQWLALYAALTRG